MHQPADPGQIGGHRAPGLMVAGKRVRGFGQRSVVCGPRDASQKAGDIVDGGAVAGAGQHLGHMG